MQQHRQHEKLHEKQRNAARPKPFMGLFLHIARDHAPSFAKCANRARRGPFIAGLGRAATGSLRVAAWQVCGAVAASFTP